MTDRSRGERASRQAAPADVAPELYEGHETEDQR